MRKKILTIFLPIAVGFVVLVVATIYFANEFAPGSYPYAEIYEFEVPEKDLIWASEQIKLIDSTYRAPKAMPLEDGRSDASDQWFHVYYYIKEERKIFHVWIRRLNEHKTQLAFVAVNEGLILGNWRQVNRHYGSRENRLIKEEFENTILRGIRNQLGRVGR